jgi:hypothetical protein
MLFHLPAFDKSLRDVGTFIDLFIFRTIGDPE